MARGVSNKELTDKIAIKVEPAHMKHYGQEQQSIIRQSSLKAAVNHVDNLLPKLNGEFNVTDIRGLILETAEAFEQWVCR